MTKSTANSKYTQTLPIVVEGVAATTTMTTKTGVSSSNKKKQSKKENKTKKSSNTNNNSTGSIFSSKFADACLDWVVFPALLFIQFGATMHWNTNNSQQQQQQNEETLVSLDWKIIHSTILLFCLIAGIYRQILRSKSASENCSIVFLLLPEIFTNILLALVMILPTITIAYYALVVLSITLAVVGCIFEYFVDDKDDDVEVTGDYQRLRDDEEDDDTVIEDWVC